jgi:hypothetical protein
MSYTLKAIEVLSAAADSLRGVVTQAYTAKAYGDLSKVAGAVDAIAALIWDLGGGESPTTAIPTPAPESKGLEVAPSAKQIAASTRTATPTVRRAGYPRYFRDGDRLLKVAWSKKERRPYEHRAPEAVVQTLIEAVRKKKGEGKLFEAADVLPLAAENGEEYPSYQSYIALAWLRHVGIVAKKGRKGYVIRPGSAAPDKVARLWASVPTVES